jgi:TatD DNase family protein
MLVDTHAHLDEHAFAHDLREVIERAKAAGVVRVVTIGITAATSRAAVSLAERHADVLAVVGIQPNYAADATDDDWETIVELSSHPRVVGVGETGLDRYWDHCPLETQVEWFHRHIDLARQVQKPFVVHCREAEADVVSVLTEAARQGELRGVMHSFSGDPATANACVELGMHISFAGMLTYKKNDELRSVAAAMPLDRLLVETDAPYLAPVPMRGKRNEPAHVRYTCECLAGLHGKSLNEMAAITSANAANLFGLTLEEATN